MNFKNRHIKGASFLVTFGQWVRPHIENGDRFMRLGLGWVSLTVYNMDLDEFITFLVQNQKSR